MVVDMVEQSVLTMAQLLALGVAMAVQAVVAH
jgi:hypothetical protein